MTRPAPDWNPPPAKASSNQHYLESGDSRPRILCLHGGGVNATIFERQCRVLIRQLPDFRLTFADAPFLSEAGPGILPIYSEWGPFRRWFRWYSTQPEVSDETIIRQIQTRVDKCKAQDAGTGPWVGVLGFSQGAKVAASILYDQQIRQEKRDQTVDSNYKFGVIMAGRGPLVSLSDHSLSPALAKAGEISTNFECTEPSPHVINIPTIHVHGLADEGLSKHRQLAELYCDSRARVVIEWDGDHRIPIKMGDVTRISTEVYKIAKQQGIVAT